MTSAAIRDARPDDYEAVAALNAQVFNLHAAARPDLYNKPEKPLARARYEDCVDERQRSRGLGSLLLSRAIELAKAWGADDVELQVSEFNEGAIRLYETWGFGTKNRKMELILQGGEA